MAFDKKRQVRGLRILLTVFYGFLLSSTLYRYVIHGTIQTIRQPTNPYAIAMIVIGGLVLISIILATYATWSVLPCSVNAEREETFFSFRFDNRVILLVSGFVLIFVFILNLIFGIVRIVKTTPNRVVSSTSAPHVLINTDDSPNIDGPTTTTKLTADSYALLEDVTKLVVELIAILFAILATFVLIRYIKAKYAAVPTRPDSS